MVRKRKLKTGRIKPDLKITLKGKVKDIIGLKGGIFIVIDEVQLG